MRPHRYLPLAALLILAAPQIATSQASRPAGSAQPVSTVRGSNKAPITILAFSDFESFPCARSASVIDGFLRQTRDVRVIFKHAPAASNPNAMLAHEAALAAGAQGKEKGDRRIFRMTARLNRRSRRLAKTIRPCFHGPAPIRLRCPAAGRVILKSQKSCSLAKTQPVSEPRPVPIRLQGAFETGSRGATFVRRPQWLVFSSSRGDKEPVPGSPGAQAPAISV
jgi:hypothetical protein